MLARGGPLVPTWRSVEDRHGRAEMPSGTATALAPTRSVACRDLDEAQDIGGSVYFPHRLTCQGERSGFAMCLRGLRLGPLMAGVLSYDVEVHIETARELDNRLRDQRAAGRRPRLLGRWPAHRRQPAPCRGERAPVHLQPARVRPGQAAVRAPGGAGGGGGPARGAARAPGRRTGGAAAGGRAGSRARAAVVGARPDAAGGGRPRRVGEHPDGRPPPRRQRAARGRRWRVAATIACDLLCWLRLLGLDRSLADAELKTLRYRILHTATRVVRGQHRRKIKVPETWPGPASWKPRSSPRFALTAPT